MSESIEKRLAHPCFPQPEDSSSLVWRYMSLAKFVALLKSSLLHLSRIDLLNDLHEGSLPVPLVTARNAMFQEHGLEMILPHTTALNQRVREASYVNCWALSSFESEALWRLYTSADDGVAIQTTYQALVNIIEPDDELYIGKVSYLDYETEWFPNGNIYYPVVHKRRAFAHENEVRLLKLRHESFTSEDSKSPPSITVPVHLESLVQSIFVTPYAEPWFAEIVQAVVEKFSPALTSRVRWSPMKNAPLY